MGDIKRQKKKYNTPMHPWSGTRIKEERVLMKNYGLVNKREVWKMNSLLTKFKDQAKTLFAKKGKQAEIEREQMINRMKTLGILSEETSLDAILSLTIEKILERRLETILVKKGLARSMKQARQFITHNHVSVNGKVINSPSYLVKVEEENTISFALNSPFIDENHPERKLDEGKQKRKSKVEEEKKEEDVEV